ncbi:hypothetical protein DPMN_065428 [Dreissena polymorpha]|uniref:Fucolectin tachylectin-4 pentraxin-1 domain-containing protein n=1 Tax=Dreissena polymorpha TaxID=45954 RepID=A0A9D3YX79_DREPO|nr:hypothetical protein DPMN_065428 [Dreissena polymorpha]
MNNRVLTAHNVAVGKNSKQTDTAYGRAAAFGNDGNMSTCTETTSSDASWEVDLGGVFQIESVIVRGNGTYCLVLKFVF